MKLVILPIVILLDFQNISATWSNPFSTSNINVTDKFNVHKISSKCTYLIKRPGQEFIKNICKSCRSVGLIRKRSGVPAPITRRYLIPPNSELRLPFRGPGRTRIANDLACKGGSNDKKSLNGYQNKNSPTSNIPCAKLGQTSKGKVYISNSCQSCRGVAI